MVKIDSMITCPRCNALVWASEMEYHDCPGKRDTMYDDEIRDAALTLAEVLDRAEYDSITIRRPGPDGWEATVTMCDGGPTDRHTARAKTPGDALIEALDIAHDEE